MNVNEIATKVFCSFCDSVTSEFIQWGDEFYCVQYCLDYLPTPEAMEAERVTREANEMARELSSLMDEVEAIGGAHTSAGSTDETMLRIEYLANYLDIFFPDLLDKRFG
jgi:hypothetical protein